jgi:hypothetical protein
MEGELGEAFAAKSHGADLPDRLSFPGLLGGLLREGGGGEEEGGRGEPGRGSTGADRIVTVQKFPFLRLRTPKD